MLPFYDRNLLLFASLIAHHVQRTLVTQFLQASLSFPLNRVTSLHVFVLEFIQLLLSFERHFCALVDVFEVDDNFELSIESLKRLRIDKNTSQRF